jgi:Ala-tRNA(Pro) deacylase
MSITRNNLFRYLNELNIQHSTIEHEPIFKVEDSVLLKKNMVGANTKNLFLKDKKGELFLVCAVSDTKINVNKLHHALGCKRLSFGKPEVLKDALGVMPGSVTLFSIINDKNLEVTLVIDKSLMNYDIVNFHPLLNDATTAISNKDMIKFAKSTKHEPVIVDFAKLE